MTRRHLCGIPVLAVLISGCGGPSISRPGPTSPHNGTLVDLPEGRGFAEVLKQPASGKAGQLKVVVYFLGPDRGPMTPAPSAVTIKGSATGNKPVKLEPPGAGDPANAGGFASPPMADRGELDLELAATVGGQAVTVPVSVR